MAYYNGSAATFADLKTAIENACVANGWTLSNGILSKNGCFFQLVATTPQLTLQGGTGRTGSTLNGGPASFVKVMSPTGTPISFPINYEIHVMTSPEDEVYCVINYNSDFYQQLSFGKSLISGIGGTGAWFTGSYDSRKSQSENTFDMNSGSGMDSGGTRGFSGMAGGIFFDALGSGIGSGYTGNYFHCGLDAVNWYNTRGSNLGYLYCAGIINSLPNQSNSATVLVPVKGIKSRSSGGLTIVVNPPSVRYCRIDNLEPGSLVVYGADRWKVYPFYRKNLAERQGSPSSVHSGTYGYAIKYTGS